MNHALHRTVKPLGGLLILAVLLTGCTLAGASAAPLTPVEGGSLPPAEAASPTPPPQQTTLPTPTNFVPPDVFATQTAAAAQPTAGEPQLTPSGAGTIVPPISATPTTTLPETTAQPTAGTPQVQPTTQAPGQTSGTCSHTVQAGENLFRIALQYGLSFQELASANGIANPDAIGAGTVLTIPGCTTDGSAGAGTGASPTPGSGAPGETTHVVQAGENLYRIALKYGLSWQALATYNGISNPDALVVGQTIRIPPSSN